MRNESRIQFVLSLILLTGLTGCTRAAATPIQNELSTIVAATLSAQPTPPPRATSTPVPSPTAVITPSPVASETPIPTASPTQTPFPSDDPRQGRQLVPASYHDDFDPPIAWWTFSNSNASSTAEGGQLVTTDQRTDFLVWWSTSPKSASDVYMEVTSWFGICSGKDSAGVAVRVGGNGFDHGYVVEIACDSTFRVRKFLSSKSSPKVLLDWTPSESIHGGSHAANRIGILAEGDELYFFVNGELLRQDPIHDSAFDSGVFALFASAYETPGLTVSFDKFDSWDLSP